MFHQFLGALRASVGLYAMEVVYDPITMRYKGLPFTAYDPRMDVIYCDDFYMGAPAYVQRFLCLHEYGRKRLDVAYSRHVTTEMDADWYAVTHMLGKDLLEAKQVGIKSLEYVFEELRAARYYHFLDDIITRVKALGGMEKARVLVTRR